MTLSSSDIQAIAQATVELLRKEPDVHSFVKKRALQSELLTKKVLTLKEVADASLLGKYSKMRLYQKCKNGDYPEGVAWYSDTEGKIYMIVEWIKNERKMRAL